MNDDPSDGLKMMHWRIAVREVIEQAEKDGVIVTVERVPLKPLAMRNHEAIIDVRMKR